jgi:hypothetical protein
MKPNPVDALRWADQRRRKARARREHRRLMADQVYAAAYAPVQLIEWKPFHFLKLPGEIRNKVYDLIIPNSHVHITGNNPNKDFERSQREDWNPMKKRPRFRLSGEIITIDDQGADPLGLLRVCRKMYHEAAPVFYSKTTPCFDSLMPIHKFLNLVPESSLKHVRSLSLTMSHYGEPELIADGQWKEAYDTKWQATCEMLANHLPGLQCLDLDLTLAAWPLQLSTKAEWTRPLRTLCGDGLHLVLLTLHHRRFESMRLGQAARRIANSMMTAAGREERDMKEALAAIREMEIEQRRKAAEPVRAKKVLIIKKEDSDAKAKVGKPTKAEVGVKAPKTKTKTYCRTKGLADYARVDLSTVNITWVD